MLKIYRGQFNLYLARQQGADADKIMQSVQIFERGTVLSLKNGGLKCWPVPLPMLISMWVGRGEILFVVNRGGILVLFDLAIWEERNFDAWRG